MATEWTGDRCDAEPQVKQDSDAYERVTRKAVKAAQRDTTELDNLNVSEYIGNVKTPRPIIKHGTEKVAAEFHGAYERLAPEYNYTTRERSAKPWSHVPPNNKALMIATIQDLMDKGIIQLGPLFDLKEVQSDAQVDSGSST
jgi:hypothetical protein